MKTINDVFSRVIIVNLDRRPDRFHAVRAQLDALGIRAERFPAVDGQDHQVLDEWTDYAAGPLVTPPKDGRVVSNYRQFYLDYANETARIAFVEQQNRRKAIATPGAWGLLLSMGKVVERAVVEGWPSLLILEDDALFHKDTTELFDHMLAQLPVDWAILQLGAMQLHWEHDWITRHSDNLYKCNGSSIGAHAVGLRQEVLPALLKACRARTLPFDIGALHAVKRRYRHRCFTCLPNLVIQDGTDSEIGMSTMFFREARKEVNLYRWQIRDYGLNAMKEQESRHRKPIPATMNDRTTPLIRGPLGRLQAWLRGSRAAPASGSPRTLPPTPSSLASALLTPRVADRQRLDLREPPLVPFSRERSNVRVVMVLAIGIVGEELPRLLDMVAKTSREDDVVPIIVTDHADFVAFRESGLIFEYLPDESQQKAHAADLEWDLYQLRRLALLKRKWRPGNTIAFGATGTSLLRHWQASPFWEAEPKVAD